MQTKLPKSWETLALCIKPIISDDYYFKIHVFRLNVVSWQNKELYYCLKTHNPSAVYILILFNVYEEQISIKVYFKMSFSNNPCRLETSQLLWIASQINDFYMAQVFTWKTSEPASYITFILHKSNTKAKTGKIYAWNFATSSPYQIAHSKTKTEC